MIDNSGTGNSNRTQRIRAAIIAFAAVVLTVSMVWFTHRSTGPAGPPKERTWEDLQAEAAAGGYKIFTTEELVQRTERDPENLLIVDTRQDWEYRTEHIKGAVVFPVEPTGWWWFRNKSKLLRLIGTDKDRSVVFY